MDNGYGIDFIPYHVGKYIGIGTGGCHTVGVGGGIGITEAAGIGGYGNIDPPGELFGHLDAHVHQKFIDDLAAGGGSRIHQFHRGVGTGGGVMINAQGNAADIRLMGSGQQRGRGDIHTDQNVGIFRCVLGQTQQAAVQKRRGQIAT